jgi:uncharacterized membrane protein YccC
VALAFVVASIFWILTDWPDGPTAIILAVVVSARFATMDGGAALAAKAVGLFVLLTVPSFIIVEVLLADSSGYPMFSLMVAPALFVAAWYMAEPNSAGVAFVSVLYFANVAGLDNRMAFDAVAFVNSSLAAIFAVALAALLFAIVGPETPQAAHRAFDRAIRLQFARIASTPHTGSTEFATATVEALDRLFRVLPADQRRQAIDAGLALLGAGIELIRVRDATPRTNLDETAARIAAVLAQEEGGAPEVARRLAAHASFECLAELRRDGLGVAAARVDRRRTDALAAAGAAFERTRGLLANSNPNGGIHAA